MTNDTSVVNVQVDRKTKEEAVKILNNLGMSMSAFINTTLKQVVINNGIPYELSLNKKPSKKLLNALSEAYMIAEEPEKYKTYSDINKMFEDIMSEDE